jgi:hypothetical protein
VRQNADVAFLNALTQIRRDALGCEFEVPNLTTIIRDKAQVRFEPDDGSARRSTRRSRGGTSAATARAGTSTTRPTAQAHPCDQTCETVTQADRRAQRRVRLLSDLGQHSSPGAPPTMRTALFHPAPRRRRRDAAATALAGAAARAGGARRSAPARAADLGLDLSGDAGKGADASLGLDLSEKFDEDFTVGAKVVAIPPLRGDGRPTWPPTSSSTRRWRSAWGALRRRGRPPSRRSRTPSSGARR